jgi:hypothetical protein
MRYTGIQPQYFPRLHYFARILNTDIFNIRDEVQFVRDHKYPDGKRGKSYQVHSPIKQVYGVNLLTIPIQHNEQNPIFETQISYDFDWITKHLNLIKNGYIKAVNYPDIYNEIKDLLKFKYKNLADLNIATICWGILKILGHKQINPDMLSLEFVNEILEKNKQFRLKEIKRTTQLKASKTFTNLTANEKIVALCQELGADEDYCGGTAVDAYVNQDLFKKNNIKITIQDWKCIEYKQQFTNQLSFIPNLSIIDLLMNTANSETVKILHE